MLYRVPDSILHPLVDECIEVAALHRLDGSIMVLVHCFIECNAEKEFIDCCVRGMLPEPLDW